MTKYYTVFQIYIYIVGEKVIGRQGKRKDQQMSATQTATIWLHDYANKFAEKQPDKTRLHLPPCLTKASLYEMYKDDMEEHAEQTISLSHFYWMWRNCVSYVSIPANSRLSKCNICTQIKTKMVETKDQNARMELKRTREQHLLKQSLERRKYYKHAHKARQHPDKYMSMIIDGMDQSKTEIPHFLYLSSLTAGMWKLRTHLVGALVHGVGLYGFFDWYQYAHSSNLTIHVILSILLMTKDSLPDVLYLQMDNCARENKNRYGDTVCIKNK
ncbi:unnamed protein product [Mytilus coruscus]|uniref:DUF7869 domain-containing protein n=1 Tax=Mytilus coruscus TaxID=42192 RepID=A0A6J8C1G7_MYTCO|nr:unnamed protein product [Mytilus coruscus]